jgi:CPA1 family monovalent cation:H+ antiporter
MSLPILLLVVAGLLAVVSLVQRLAARFTLPASILLSLLGIAVGGVSTFVIQSGTGGSIGEVARAFADVPVTSETFLFVFVPALIFQSALTVDVRRVMEDAAPILLLAVVAVLVATAFIGLALVPFATVPALACLLLASIVSTTDTVAVVSIFRDVGAPARLCRLVEGESLLNDAAAIITFTVLLGLLLGGSGMGPGRAVLAFLWTFTGGILVGYAFARLTVAVLPALQDLRLAQVTLTLALPYIAYIVADRGFEVSGVIATVTAGLVMSAIGQPRVAPSAWAFLLDLWEQLAYWASSLIFLLAALLVPRHLLLSADSNLHFVFDVHWYDALLLVVQLAAALAARAVILFGVFPLLTRFRMSRGVSNRFSVVILWGGLRGAVTLALALAITENTAISPEIRRFVAVQATGFTLFTLLVQGLTLRPLIQMLGLDKLSPFDEALRAQVLAISRSRVAEAVRRIGRQYGFGDALIGTVAESYATAAPSAPEAPAVTSPALAIASDAEQMRLALVALTQREREIVLEHFGARTISGQAVAEVLRDVDVLLDRVRTRGETEYLPGAHQIVGFSREFRFALWLHRRLHMEGPLVDRLADRFERLLIGRIVLDELPPYIDDPLAPLVHERIVPRLKRLLSDRQQMTGAALEAMRAQYPGYAALLEQRFLQRVGMRREDLEYRALFDEHVIGPELYNALQRDVQAARGSVHARPALDLGLETRELIARVPLFSGLGRDDLASVARLLQPRFAVPDERLIATGDPGDSMYFIASGIVEVQAASQRILLSRGDFFGEMALVLHQPRGADVVARSYCQLLVLDDDDFQPLLRSSRSIRESINQAAAERLRMNAGQQGAPAATEPT